MKKKLALTLALAVTAASMLAGCGGAAEDAAQADTGAAGTEASSDLVYAVEAGSAGEEAANANGFQTNVVASQADALMEVASGTSDAAIIDLLMAGAMIGEGTSYPDLKYTTELTSEEYGVGCRKGSDLAEYINIVFADTYEHGIMKQTATTYGVQEALVEQPALGQMTEVDTTAADSDVAYIQGKGTLIVGITDFAPMDYKDESGE